ncbi:MAG: MerR family transcriptional regulator [Actinomycetota bacterium]|nr:MerR family transcriptional regulator [Actinomycetota bacterium]
MRTVKQVSELAGVTIRTLHYYDDLGLLTPTGRSEAGYRLYDHCDLERLQEIVAWRQLGFSLTEIRALLDDPAHDRRAALSRLRELVSRELERLGATARALDAAIAAVDNGHPEQENTMFPDFDHTQCEEEARERWGHTEAYQESARRSAAYGDAERAEIRSEADAVLADFAAAMAGGESADGETARGVAERHRQHMTRWFYPVGPKMHRNLAELYISDPRFAAHYEQVATGLAVYVRAAILANADGPGSPAAISPRS